MDNLLIEREVISILNESYGNHDIIRENSILQLLNDCKNCNKKYIRQIEELQGDI
jgi:hypothetical protein